MWCISSSLVFVHLNQSGFASNLVESFFRETREASLLATSYRSGIPVDSIALSMDEDDLLAQIRWTQAYQSLIGSIGWLAMTTRPDLTAIHSFLSSYIAKPVVGHMKSALHTLHYIHSTFDYGINFTSEATAPMHSHIHYPPSTDVEAYTDAIPPKPSTIQTITAYSNACWGLKIGNAVAEGTLLPLVRFHSMNGGIIFKNSGPIGWLGKHQERMSLSSCEAEI